MRPKSINTVSEEFEKDFFHQFIEDNQRYLTEPIYLNNPYVDSKTTEWKSLSGNIIFRISPRSKRTNYFIILKREIQVEKSSGLFGIMKSVRTYTEDVNCKFGTDITSEFQISNNEKSLFQNLIESSKKYKEEFDTMKSEFLEKEKLERTEKGLKIKNRVELKEKRIQKKTLKLKNDKEKLLDELDSNRDGILDILESRDFDTLLRKHQNKIKLINRDYIQLFVKISNYLKMKGQNLQLVFNGVTKVSSQEKLKHLKGLLRNQIHTYQTVYLHSLNMLVSLIEEDDITFYEIYEVFDKLEVFNSKWENDVSSHLSNINKSVETLNKNVETLNKNVVLGFTGLMFQIDELEGNLLRGMKDMVYLQGNYMKELGLTLTKELNNIDSSIKVNNLLTGISTYQLYKINKNTKSLRS